MKPNNLVALLLVVILLAIGIALAIINKRSESNTGKAAVASVVQSQGTQPFRNDTNLS